MRIAKVRQTGHRYLVQRMEFPVGGAAKVHVWGEVTSFKTGRASTYERALDTKASTRHGASMTFLASEVDVEEVEVTGRLARSLFDQATSNLKLAGARVRRMR